MSGGPVPMERLWAGWRSTYITGVAESAHVEGDCLFCGLLGLDDESALILERTDLTFTVMNAPRTPRATSWSPLRSTPPTWPASIRTRPPI